MAVIGKGLEAGEKVVVNGQYRLANNAKRAHRTRRTADGRLSA